MKLKSSEFVTKPVTKYIGMGKNTSESIELTESELTNINIEISVKNNKKIFFIISTFYLGQFL